MTFSGVNRDLHLGYQKVTWKKLVWINSINFLNGTLPRDPGPSKLRDRAMIDTQVCSGCVEWVRSLEIS